MVAAGREDLANDPRLAHNDGRVEHEQMIDAAIETWTRQRTFDEVFAALEASGVPTGPIYSVAEILNDPHYQARGMFEEVEISDRETLKLPTFIPKLSRTPGGTRWIGPPLGAHNDEVYSGLLGLCQEEIARLYEEGVI
jgi:crotonobetainyl-CoA:carnitine CoA-transferase CaiB-like acyl-CoA transferase